MQAFDSNTKMIPSARALRPMGRMPLFRRRNEDMQNPAMLPAPAMIQAGKQITEERLRKAKEKLNRYIAAKAMDDDRIVSNEAWWQGRNFAQMQEQGNEYNKKRPTMWTVNVIMGKHADMLEAYPEPAILPREKSDEMTADMLTHIVPVVMEQNEFETTYNLQAWKKNKSGTAIYGIFWDTNKLNGLGDIQVSAIEPLNIFWEPGITDIQKSENVFLVEKVNREQLEKRYPQIAGKTQQSNYGTKDYTQSRANEEDKEKVVIVDWYYHTWQGKKKTLHYCKFCGDTVLYASEEDPAMEKGWYHDGNYPFVIDALFPQEKNLMGLGYIDRCKNAQESIDLLDQAITLNALANAIPRFLVNEETGINMADFFDLTKNEIYIEGSLDETHIRQIQVPKLDGSTITVMNNKIEELKQTSGNQDVNNGSTSGVTSASGIAALQQAAGRTSKSAIKNTYTAYAKIIKMVIERIRQFYDTPRKFRILGTNMRPEFVEFDNKKLQMQPLDVPGYEDMMRLPVFDVHVEAQKKNPYSKMAQNELSLQLLNAGVFNPQMVDQSMLLLESMDFDGKDKIQQKLAEMGGMQQQLLMMQQIALGLAKKYEPQTAEELSMMIMGQAGQTGAMLPPADVEIPEEAKESGVTAKARQRSAEASQPT